MQMMDRTRAVLNSTTLIYSKENVAQAVEFIRANGLADEERPSYIEIDQARYDKSQGKRALMLEYIWSGLMGMDRAFLVLWERVCRETTLTSDEGFRLFMDYQRKSGYSDTTPGNTVVNLITVCAELPIDKPQYIAVLGDDSVIRLSRPIETGRAELYMAEVWNLSAQVSQFKFGYFCSAFIIHTPTVCALMPDPIKRFQKLRMAIKMIRSDPKRPGQVLDPIEEKYISFKDNMACYLNDVALHHLDVAVMERYGKQLFSPGVTSCRPLLLCLATLVADEQSFRSLFTTDVVIRNV